MNTTGNICSTLNNSKIPEKEMLWKSVDFYLEKIYLALYIVSIIGNVLTVIVMVKRIAAQSSSTATSLRILFASLAVSDILIMLMFSFFDTVPNGQWTVSLVDYTDCYTYTFKHISNSILAMITIERVICVGMPLHARRLASPRRIVITLVIIVLGLFIFDTVNYFCFYDFYWVAYYPIDLYRGFVPQFVIITIGSTFIIAKLTCFKAIGKKSSEATILLIAANALFVVTLLPYRLYNYFSDSYVFFCSPDMDAILFFMCRPLFRLERLNAMLNFYLYVLCGKKFRAEIFSLFMCSTFRTESVRNNNSSGTNRTRMSSENDTSVRY